MLFFPCISVSVGRLIFVIAEKENLQFLYMFHTLVFSNYADVSMIEENSFALKQAHTLALEAWHCKFCFCFNVAPFMYA